MTDREIIEELCAVLEECADDLEARIRSEHFHRDMYPHINRAFNAEMAAVHRARAALAKAKREK